MVRRRDRIWMRAGLRCCPIVTAPLRWLPSATRGFLPRGCRVLLACARCLVTYAECQLPIAQCLISLEVLQ